MNDQSWAADMTWAEWHVAMASVKTDCGQVGQTLSSGLHVRITKGDALSLSAEYRVVRSDAKRGAWMRIGAAPCAVFLFEYSDGSIAGHYAHLTDKPCAIGVIPPELMPFARSALNNQSQEFNDYVTTLIGEE